MAQKRILCVALYLDDGKPHTNQPANITSGFIIAGRRHDDCYETLSIICRVSGGSAMKFDILAAKRGFLSSDGFFYDRKEAFLIALEAGQVSTAYQNGADEDSSLVSDQLY